MFPPEDHEINFIEMIIGKYIHKNTKSILDHLNPNIIHDFNLIYEHLLLYFLSINKDSAIREMDRLKYLWSMAIKDDNYSWIDKKTQFKLTGS